MSSGKSALKIVQKYHPNVTKVVDAKRPLQISVTEEDCKGSKKRKPDACALAKACERKYDGAIVSLAVAYLIKGNRATRYRVPQAVSRELVSFDRHHDFAPGKYHLRAPKEGEKLGARKYPQPENKPGGNVYSASKSRNHKTAGIRAL